jgi:hypothetical protein
VTSTADVIRLEVDVQQCFGHSDPSPPSRSSACWPVTPLVGQLPIDELTEDVGDVERV